MHNAIYTITNIFNGKVYVGETSNIVVRWAEHRKMLNNGTHHSKKLQEDWNTYGEDAFEFKVIAIDPNVPNKYLRLLLEDLFIHKYNSVCKGYNMEFTLPKVEKGIYTIKSREDDTRRINSIRRDIMDGNIKCEFNEVLDWYDIIIKII